MCIFADIKSIGDYVREILKVSEKNEIKKEQDNFLQYIHTFRGLAILLIVGSHIFYGWRDENMTISIINTTVRGTTILFLFISGYLFQHLSYKFKPSRYFSNKLKYVILPYILISIPIIFAKLYDPPSYALSHFDNPVLSLLYQSIHFLITGEHLLPFWFIPMIVLFYLMAPLLYYLDKKAYIYYLLPVFVVISLMVPRTELNDIPRLFVHFFSVYLFGMFMSHYKIRILEFSNQYWKILAIATLIVSVVVLFLPYDSYPHLSAMYIQKMMLCWFFIYFLQKYAHKLPRKFDLLAEFSFGIYFLHYFFALAYRKGLEKVFDLSFSASPFLWLMVWIVGLLVVTLGSMLLIAISRKIFGDRSRLLIGS
ncbi:MAG: acyltransferase family protein [Cyclobacteriaceae bacterium]